MIKYVFNDLDKWKLAKLLAENRIQRPRFQKHRNPNNGKGMTKKWTIPIIKYVFNELYKWKLAE